MNESLKKLPITEVSSFIKKHSIVLFFVLFASIFVYLILFISGLNSQEASSKEVEAELQTVKRLNIDNDAAQQMLKLTEENIEIQTLYNDARNNPFSE